jgi:predicted Zn finger-like uncharacterized protein
VNFACDRCAKRYSLPDAKVPPQGFRITCKKCGNVIVVAPARPAVPELVPELEPLPEPTPVPVLAAAPAPAPMTPRRAAVAPLDEHERFFASGLASPAPDRREEVLFSRAVQAPNHLPAIAIGAIVLVGLMAGGLWMAGRKDGGAAVTGVAGERPGGAGPESLEGSPRPARAEPIPAMVGPAAPPPPRRGGPASPAGGRSRSAAAAATRDQVDGSRTGIGKRDRKLLDLLDRKQDAAGVAPPSAGELSTGRDSLEEATVRHALEANSSAFSACIGRAAKADPGLRHKKPLVLELVVRPSGRVSQAAVQDPQYQRTVLGQCLVAAARRLVFPSFEGEEILVQAPLKLSAVQ